MSRTQLERLKQDSKELSHQITKQQKRGNSDKAYKLSKKQQWLQMTIEEYTNAA